MFVRAVLHKTKAVFRYVNSQDIVTQVPPEVPLAHYFRHAGLEKYIDRSGVIQDHPSEFDKALDVTQGTLIHDGQASLKAIGHVEEFCKNVILTGPWVDPPIYMVGNHTPARYAVRIWNHYSGL